MFQGDEISTAEKEEAERLLIKMNLTSFAEYLRDEQELEDSINVNRVLMKYKLEAENESNERIRHLEEQLKRIQCLLKTERKSFPELNNSAKIMLSTTSGTPQNEMKGCEDVIHHITPFEKSQNVNLKRYQIRQKVKVTKQD